MCMTCTPCPCPSTSNTRPHKYGRFGGFWSQMSFGQWPRSRSAAASFSAAAARAAAAFSSDTFARMDQSEYRNVEAGTSKIGAHFDLCSPCCSLVCRVAMAAQAISMQARFDSSFLCRLGASVERLHHLARPSREDTMHRAHSDVCTRHRMPCCLCCSQQIWIDLSLHQVVEARLPAAQASWHDPVEDRTGPNRARYYFNLGATGHLPHTTL